MIDMKVLDQKHFTLLSSVYSSKTVNTGRKHWQTKNPIDKPEIVHIYISSCVKWT